MALACLQTFSQKTSWLLDHNYWTQSWHKITFISHHWTIHTCLCRVKWYLLINLYAKCITMSNIHIHYLINDCWQTNNEDESPRYCCCHGNMFVIRTWLPFYDMRYQTRYEAKLSGCHIQYMMMGPLGSSPYCIWYDMMTTDLLLYGEQWHWLYDFHYGFMFSLLLLPRQKA
jgi:hypothetical protein